MKYVSNEGVIWITKVYWYVLYYGAYQNKGVTFLKLFHFQILFNTIVGKYILPLNITENRITEIYIISISL